MISKVIGLCVIVTFFSGCASAVSPERSTKSLPVSYAVPGTSTAVVGIGLNKEGMPLETVKAVVLKPGQKVVFAGPEQFSIVFKNRKFPAKVSAYKSEKGVIQIVIPKNILEQPEFREEYAKNKQVEFNYAIRVNGKELDPPLVIKNED